MNLEQSFEAKDKGMIAAMTEAWRELQSAPASGVARSTGWQGMGSAMIRVAETASRDNDAELLTDALLLTAIALSHAADACGESLRDPLSLLQCAAA